MMKKQFILLIVCFLLIGLFVCCEQNQNAQTAEEHDAMEQNAQIAETPDGHTIPHYVYTEDFPTVYQDELKAIFGDYTLGERKETHIEGLEYFIKEQYNRSVDYYEWEITYTDACGQTMTRTMHNRWSFYVQQVEWLKEQIQEHFWTNCVVPHFGEWMEQGSIGIGSYCFCFIGRISTSWYNEETRGYLEIGDQYWENLQKRTDPIPMHALSYPEIFDRYPIELCINVRLSEDGVEEAEWPERFTTAKVLLDQMVAEITEEIGNELNLKATVGRSRLDIDQSTRFYTVHILRGERYECGPDYIDGDFERAIMDSYKGKFW